MTKLKLLGGAIIFLTTVVWGTAAAWDVADVNGNYSTDFEGTLTVTDASSGQSQVVPLTSIGRFVANGAGQGSVVGSLNLGGFAIIPLASTAENSATYSVNDADTGLGVITTPVLATAVPEFPLGAEAVPPGFDFTGAVEFELNFVIVNNDQIKLIGTKLSAIDSATGGKTPLGALVLSGSATKQAPDSTP